MNQHTRKTLDTVKQAGKDGLLATEVATLTDCSINKVTAHLHALTQRGFVQRLKEENKKANGSSAMIYRYFFLTDTPKPKKDPRQRELPLRQRKEAAADKAETTGLTFNLRIRGGVTEVTWTEGQVLYEQLKKIYGGK
jgi:hypothetical protein